MIREDSLAEALKLDFALEELQEAQEEERQKGGVEEAREQKGKEGKEEEEEEEAGKQGVGREDVGVVQVTADAAGAQREGAEGLGKADRQAGDLPDGCSDH